MAAPKRLCDTKGMSEAEWLKCRDHGPDGDIDFAVGGSNMAAIFNVSPWETAKELSLIKRGLMKPPEKTNGGQLWMGHLLEPIVAKVYASKTGHKIIEDTGLYQHALYEWALANIDYLTEDDDGRRGVLECKSTTYRKAAEWDDGMVPIYYMLQCVFYMAVLDLDFCDIACMWGNNPDTDFAIVHIERDMEQEEYVMSMAAEFIDGLRKGVDPTIAGVPTKVALESLARIYARGNAKLPSIEFGPAHEKNIKEIAQLQVVNKGLKAKMDENDKTIAGLSVALIEIMGEHETGEFVCADGRFLISMKTRYTTTFNRKELQKEHPEIFAKFKGQSVSRKLKVEKAAAKAAGPLAKKAA